MTSPGLLASPQSAPVRPQVIRPAAGSAGDFLEGRRTDFVRWPLTRLIRRSGRIDIYRARSAEQQSGPGCYVVKLLAGCRSDDAWGRAMLKREAAVAVGVNCSSLVSVV